MEVWFGSGNRLAKRGDARCRMRKNVRGGWIRRREEGWLRTKIEERWKCVVASESVGEGGNGVVRMEAGMFRQEVR